MTTDNLIQQAAQAIKNSRQIAVLTGAGVSKESGVPTFRDAQTGLWAKYDPEQLASRLAFQADPKMVWEWYEFRRGMVNKAKPNPGHIALAELEKRYPTMQVITQNVDDLHEQAGSKNVTHLHGNIARNKCFNDCQGNPTPIDITTLKWDKDSGPPECPHCGSHVRPDIVWFGELLSSDDLDTAQKAAQDCDVMLVIGTSGLVSPASQIPGIAKNTGATLIEVNPDYSMITRIADIKLEAPSGESLPRVIEALDDAE